MAEAKAIQAKAEATQAKVETTQAKVETTQTEGSPDDASYIAEVVNIYNKSGAGGDITLCRVLLRHNGRSIVRSVEGPIRVGDKLSLRECVRESRKSR